MQLLAVALEWRLESVLADGRVCLLLSLLAGGVRWTMGLFFDPSFSSSVTKKEQNRKSRSGHWTGLLNHHVMLALGGYTTGNDLFLLVKLGKKMMERMKKIWDYLRHKFSTKQRSKQEI
jgi:hypothetical protein